MTSPMVKSFCVFLLTVVMHGYCASAGFDVDPTKGHICLMNVFRGENPFNIMNGVFVEDGSKYCPDVLNKEQTTFVIGDSCYHYVEKPDINMISFDFALKDCVSRAGHLMIIKNQQIQSAVFEQLNMDIADSHTVLLGLQKHGSTWKWVDGNTAAYSNWKPGTNQTFNCVHMNLKDSGYWETFDCALQDWYPAYVCEFNKSSSSGGHPVASFGVVIITLLSLSTLMSYV